MQSRHLKSVHKIDNLEAAWRTIHANARSSKSEIIKHEVDEFAANAGFNLRSIRSRLSRGKFKFRSARGVPLPKRDSKGRPTGKFRPIVLPPVESRIVQRALLNVLVELPGLAHYVDNPFSFGGTRKRRGLAQGKIDDDMAGVPAAIHRILNEIRDGAAFVACADIRSFFTRIPKPLVTSILSSTMDDAEFVAFFESAIRVELSNMAQLREKAQDFPIEEIGVAQGNSLSPLLGNITLESFDSEMNEGDCRCLRYIDDFIILGHSAQSVNQHLRHAKRLLGQLGMDLSPEKSSKGARSLETGFEFLGICISPGLIRPSDKAQRRLLESIASHTATSSQAFQKLRGGAQLEKSYSLINTLKRIDGIVDAWGKQYKFCNDGLTLQHLDSKIDKLVREFVGTYADTRSRTENRHHRSLLGIAELAKINRSSFAYPKKNGRPKEAGAANATTTSA